MYDFTKPDTGQRFVIYWKDYPIENEWTPIAYLNREGSAEYFFNNMLNREQRLFSEIKVVDRSTNEIFTHKIDE